MPIINGKVCRARFTSLKLDEISSVDNPAQPGALARLCKRFDGAGFDRDGLGEVLKYVCDADGAHSFVEVLSENKFAERIWPYTDALTQSIRSIVGDGSLAGAEREQAITESVNGFLAAVRSISPEIEPQLEVLISKKDFDMSKTVEQLEAEIGTLKAENATLKSERDQAVTAKGEVETKLTAAEKALVEATDETITVGDQTVKKSEVGAASFSVTKALVGERDLARLEKRADDEFKHVVGTAAEKALVLKSVAGLPEDNPVRKTLEAIMASAEKMTAQGFETLGSGGGNRTPTNKAAESTFNAKVAEIAKRDSIPTSKAMSKAREEFPAEFAAYQGEGTPEV